MKKQSKLRKRSKSKATIDKADRELQDAYRRKYGGSYAKVARDVSFIVCTTTSQKAVQMPADTTKII